MSRRNHNKSYRANEKKKRRELLGMQIFHGKTKGMIYMSIKGAERVMEFGAGKLNDLLNWEKADFKKIYAIEEDKASILKGKEKYDFNYKKRLRQMKGIFKHRNETKIGDLPEIISLQADINHDYTKIIKHFGEVRGMMDHIVCNFAIHYFMKDKKSLTNLVKLVNYFLKIGGTFKFTCLNGIVLYNFLKINTIKEDKIRGGIEGGEGLRGTVRPPIDKKLLKKLEKKLIVHGVYHHDPNTIVKDPKNQTVELYGRDKSLALIKIKRKYDADEKFDKYGQMIGVYIHSIGKFHDEYLVNIKNLINVFGKQGYSIDDIKPFGEYMDTLIKKQKKVKMLSEVEYQYSNMNVSVSLLRK